MDDMNESYDHVLKSKTHGKKSMYMHYNYDDDVAYAMFIYDDAYVELLMCIVLFSF